MENIDNFILDELLNDDDDDENEVEDLLILVIINDQGKEINNNELCNMFQLYTYL